MITRQQAISESTFHCGECTQTISPTGMVTTHIESWRRNGTTQLWKTRPDDFRVPIKYGLRNHSAITEQNADNFHCQSDCPIYHDPVLIQQRHEADLIRNLPARLNRLIEPLRPKDRKRIKQLPVAAKLKISQSAFPEAVIAAVLGGAEL